MLMIFYPGLCFSPPLPTNGFIYNAMDIYMEGATVFYNCFDGYYVMDLNGPYNNNCTSDGTWSNDAPICSGMILSYFY